MANRKGIQFPLERIESALSFYFCKSLFSVINYIRDKYNLDIYEIQKRTQFFDEYLWYQIDNYETLDTLKNGFNALFSELPIDLNKMLHVTVKQDLVWNRIRSLINFSFDTIDGLLYLKEVFTQTIFTLETLSKCIKNCYDSDIRRVLYDITMFDENEKLSDHIDKILQEEDWSDFTDTDYLQFSITDPKHLIAIYRLVNS